MSGKEPKKAITIGVPVLGQGFFPWTGGAVSLTLFPV